MKLDGKLLAELESNLGLNIPFVKGQTIKVNKCWHFYTNGRAVDALFYDETDFISGMNRIYTTVVSFKVVVLAFTLMDTHVHFILYGELDDCKRFVYEYLRRTSQYIEDRHHQNNKLSRVRAGYQCLDDEKYLKTAICYTLRNAPVGGLGYTAWDYPWSSGSLYFRNTGYWNSPDWLNTQEERESSTQMTCDGRRKVMRSRLYANKGVRMVGDVVFPGEYVASEIVERLFRSCRAFNYFMSTTREDEFESHEGLISNLSIPMQEMRQNKRQVCRELFGTESVKGLDTASRLRLARALRSRYNSSVKQIVRLCGLVYDEVKGLI